MEQMQGRNPTCMGEVMEHVSKQGVTDVREVEDALLAHIGLVPTLEREGRPATSPELDRRLAKRMRTDVANLSSWLVERHATVEYQLKILAWQPVLRSEARTLNQQIKP